MKRILIVVLLLVFLSPLPGFSEERIKIGISCALSGPYAPLAKVYLAGWETYFKKVNEMGGIDGKKLQWRAMDDKYDPGMAVENTKKLIDWGAKILAGYVGIDTTRRVVAFLEEKNVNTPLFFPMTSSKFIKATVEDRLYSLRPYVDDEVSVIVNYFIKEKGFEKWGIFYEDNATGVSGKYAVERKLADYNVKPVYEKSHKGDYKHIDLGAIKKNNPQIIIIVSSAKVSRVFIEKVAEAFGKEKMPVVVALSSVFPCSYVKKVSKCVGPSNFWFTQATPYPKDTSYSIVRDYLNDLNRFSLGESPCFISLEGYVAAKVMCDILARAGSTSLSAIEVAAENTRIDVGIGKTIVFNNLVHRSPIGVGLYEVLDEKPTVKTVLWNDFNYRRGSKKSESAGNRAMASLSANKKDISVDVKIKKVRPAEIQRNGKKNISPETVTTESAL